MSTSTAAGTSVSCLVISRTPDLLNRLLRSLAEARRFWHASDEVLCSWNGSDEGETEINPMLGPCSDGQPLFRIAQRCAYHFSSNMNGLADLARGDLLILLNDDLILDPGSLDRAIQVLQTQPDAGLVGGRLRGSNGQLTHAGLLFDNNHIPYNRFHPDDLGPLINASSAAVQESGPMPAVTGALMVLRRSDFQAVRFRTEYRVCGEDIALCLDIWSQRNKHPYYAGDVSAIHDEKTTRGNSFEQDDIRRLASFAATVIPHHLGLQAAGRHWAWHESSMMWHLLQSMRHNHDQAVSNLAEKERVHEHVHSKAQERIHVLQQQVNRAENTIQAMTQSSSWQLTAPLRLLADKIKPSNRSQAAARETQASSTAFALPAITASDIDNSVIDTGIINLVFDALIMGQANRASVSRGGIYRYASELLIGLQRSGELTHLLPYCPDPLLANSVEQELAQLEQRFGVSLRQKQHSNEDKTTAATLTIPTPPAAIKRLIKPLYRRWLASPLARDQAARQLQATLQNCLSTNTVFHTPFQSVPPEVRQSSLRATVVTVHDMLPRIHPEFFTTETIRQFDALIEQLLPSDHVICVSESTRRDFLRCSPSTPENQVHVTPLAASPDLQPVSDPAALANLREQLNLKESDQVILSLCTLEPRKNLTTLIQAFEQLQHHCDGSSIKLVLAGSLGWKTTTLTEQLRTSTAADSIIVSGHIPDHQLACLYSLADIFVYPSVYEGFGLPPLEAMQCGTPVIVGNTSSLPEVVGDAAVIIDPRSPSELQRTLGEVLGSAQQRADLRAAGLKRASQFSWHKTASETAQIYRKVLEFHG